MKKITWLLLIVFMLGIKTQMYGHGSAGHIGMYDKLLDYYLTNYGTNDPYYLIIRDYPEFVKFGSILPDMSFVNSGKPALQNLYDNVLQETGQPLTYQIVLGDVPDPYDPAIGTNSFGIDTHDYRYAFAFAQYLLDQANLADPPGVDPGGTGFDAVSRAQKLALAIGYYLHLCQDIEAHNYWIPKLTAESGLAELSIFETKDIGQYYEIVPGGQTHSATEVLHDYRLGLTKCQDVATTLHTDFWYCAGSTGIPVQILDGVIITGQFEPPAGPVFYPASSNGQPELYEGLNPALHFFYKVLQDWHQNNPLGLNYEHTSGPLIS